MKKKKRIQFTLNQWKTVKFSYANMHFKTHRHSLSCRHSSKIAKKNENNGYENRMKKKKIRFTD